MSKYIDADKLIAELTKMQFSLNAAYRKPQADNIVRAISLEYDDIISLVSSLQQEQTEVDLDAEIAIYLNRNVLNRINSSDIIEDFTTMEAGELASHFYALGLNARKEEKQ